MIGQTLTQQTSCFDELSMERTIANDAELSSVHPELVEG